MVVSKKQSEMDSLQEPMASANPASATPIPAPSHARVACPAQAPLTSLTIPDGDGGGDPQPSVVDTGRESPLALHAPTSGAPGSKIRLSNQSITDTPDDLPVSNSRVPQPGRWSRPGWPPRPYD